MCRAISILKKQISRELLEKYELERRIIRRRDDADEELLFDFAKDRPRPELPVEHDGQLRIYTWGDRNRETRLPHTGWCREESLEAGKWKYLSPEPVLIPCVMGLEKGIWFNIDQGIRGIVVRDQQEQPHVYMLTVAATVYFHNMTRHDRMPVLHEQTL
jgi:hypothetical protein